MISLLEEFSNVTGIVTTQFYGETGLDVKKLEKVTKLKIGSPLEEECSYLPSHLSSP